MKFHPYSSMLLETPVAVLVCGDLRLEDSLEYISLNSAAATQNMLLLAFEMGRGSVWQVSILVK